MNGRHIPHKSARRSHEVGSDFSAFGHSEGFLCCAVAGSPSILYTLVDDLQHADPRTPAVTLQKETYCPADKHAIYVSISLCSFSEIVECDYADVSQCVPSVLVSK